MKKKLFFLFALAALLCTSVTAGVVQYDCVIDSGQAVVSGGIGGGYVETQQIVGSFSLVHDTATNGMSTANIDIEPVGNHIPLGWDRLEGTFNAPYISLAAKVPGFADNTLSGTLSGKDVYLHGILHDGIYDGYQYNCEINATVINVVPEPATMSLLAVGSMCLLRRRK